MKDMKKHTIYSLALLSSMSLLMVVGCAGNDTMKYQVDTAIAESEDRVADGVESQIINMLTDDEVGLAEVSTDQHSNQFDAEMAVINGNDLNEATVLVEPAEVTAKPLEARVAFGFDDASVNDEYADMLWQHALYLKENSSLVLQISGHTDQSGDPAYNQYLSKKRAESVSNLLIEYGAPAERINIGAYSSEQPLAGAINHREHRRVEMEYQDQQIVSN